MAALKQATGAAGVMYEVVQAVGRHNLGLPADSDHRIEIDLITAASVGGMTAAILCRKLPYEAGDPYGAETDHTRGHTAAPIITWAGKRLGRNFWTRSRKAAWQGTTCPLNRFECNEAVPVRDPSLAKIDIEQLSEDKRRRLKNKAPASLSRAVNDQVKSWWVRMLIQYVAKPLIVGPLLDEKLKLKKEKEPWDRRAKHK